MGSYPRGISPPSWLNGVDVIRHVKGGIWEINLTGYGRTLVGPYSELDRYLSAKGLGEDAHHIVGKEHLGDVRTGFNNKNAPAVALERRLHNSLITPQTRELQEHLGGRSTAKSGRPEVTRKEVKSLYRELYTEQTNFRELATISDNVLKTQPQPTEIGEVKEQVRAPKTDPAKRPLGKTKAVPKAPKVYVDPRGVGDRGIDAKGISKENTAMDNVKRGAVNRIESAEVPRKASLFKNKLAKNVAKRIPKLAVAKVALRKAGTVVFSFLARSIIRLIPILNFLDIYLFAVDIIYAVVDYYRSREIAIDVALLEGLKKEIPDVMTNTLEKQSKQVARFYVQAWENKKQSCVILYLSPRVFIYDRSQDGSFDFKAVLEVKDLASDLLTTRIIPFTRDDLGASTLDYYVYVRWSVENPLFTPFDIFQARIYWAAELVIDQWLYLYQDKRKLEPQLENDFYQVARGLAEVLAQLKQEPFLGFDLATFRFDKGKGGLERYLTLEKAAKTIQKTIVPGIEQLINRGSITAEGRLKVRTNETDEFSEEVAEAIGEKTVIPVLEWTATEMSHINSACLEYERFETVAQVQNRYETGDLGLIPFADTDRELADILSPVRDYLPPRLKPNDFYYTDSSDLQVKGD